MSDNMELSRDALLSRAPADYLAEGWRGPDGGIRRELLGTDATAVATQLVAAEASPQELAFTYEAVRALLEMQDGGDAATRMRDAVDEALMTVARMIRQPNNEGIAGWITECAGFVQEDADIEAMLSHVQAVLRMHGLMASLPPPGPWPDDAAPSAGSSSDGPG